MPLKRKAAGLAAILALGFLFGGVPAPQATAQISLSIDRSIKVSNCPFSPTGYFYMVDVSASGLGSTYKASNIIWEGIPNTNLDYPGLAASIASINSTLGSSLSSAMETYMNSIDSVTAKFQKNTADCWARNETNQTYSRCANPNIIVWAADLDSAIDEFEASVTAAITVANEEAKAVMDLNYLTAYFLRSRWRN